MKHLWERLYLSSRLLILTAFVFFSVSLVYLGLSIRSDSRAIEDSLKAILDNQLTMLPASLTEMLVIGDLASVHQTLELFAKNRPIERIVFHDSSGAKIEVSSNPHPYEAPQWYGAALGVTGITGTRDSIIGGRNYGSTEITLSNIPSINDSWKDWLRGVKTFVVILLLNFACVWLVLKSSLLPLRKVAEGANELASGKLETQVEPGGSHEVRVVVSAFNGMANAISQSHMALEADKQKFQQLFEMSPVGIAMINYETGEYLEVNRALQEFTGFSRDELLRMTFRDITPEEYESQELAQMESLAHLGRFGPNEKEYIRKDGTRFPIRISGFLITGADDRKVVWGLIEDITASRAAEVSMREAKEIAERTAQAKSEFLANMSHEIRTPMNGIIGLSTLALNQQASPAVRDYLEKISSSSQSLLGILNDILDFSKLEAGRMTVESAQFDLDRVLDNLRNLFEARADEKHLDFRIDVGDGTPRELVGDAMRLQQILSNLIGNSIKFTSQGHVTLRVMTKSAEGSSALLRFCVEDSGIGLSEEDKTKLFQPFSQGDGSITRKYGGTGLGLAISNDLLKLMGGKFDVISQPGQGATFCFELLLGIASLAKENPARYRTDPGRLEDNLKKAATVLTGASILVAEDNSINQQVIQEFLKLAGLRVTIANNGLEALQLLEKQDFDAILMDIHMPVMGGVEATMKIRQNAKYQDLPIIALTAGVTEDEKADCLASGLNDFIGKPLTPEALIKTMSRWIRPKS